MKNKPRSTTIRFFIRSLLVNCFLMLIPLLLISTYSIYRTTNEGTEAAAKSASFVLSQTNDILDSFYQDVDNAYLFFDSNPRVSLQLKGAFKEQSLSLSSLKSIENISLNFQNLIYTDNYLRNIYIYYENDYSRIYAPLSAKLLSFPADRESEILDLYHHQGSADVWMEFSDKPLLYSDYHTPSLVIYRKLYRRTTDNQNGLIIFNFEADRILRKMDSLLETSDQQLFLIDSHNQIVWPSSDDFSADSLLKLAREMPAGSETTAVCSHDFGAYRASFLPSPRSYGFSYLLLTPKQHIYNTSINLMSMYIIITLIAILMACILAFVKTQHDYRYLGRIINVFSQPETALLKTERSGQKSSSPFEYILMNVIQLFLEQNYLKVQDSEKAAKLQLSRMQALQHQINPHFLHNTLNNIYWESVKLFGDENICSQMITNLSTIMRYSLSDPQDDVSIREEINYLKKYLEIMKLRHNHNFDVKFSIAPDCQLCPIKKMLLQPLVENSVYHGFKGIKKMGFIHIKAHQKNNRIYFSIYDNGNGMTDDQLASLRDSLTQNSHDAVSHIGVTNTNSRLILSYGEDSQLHIDSRKDHHTVVWFSIPVDVNS